MGTLTKEHGVVIRAHYGVFQLFFNANHPLKVNLTTQQARMLIPCHHYGLSWHHKHLTISKMDRVGVYDVRGNPEFTFNLKPDL